MATKRTQRAASEHAEAKNASPPSPRPGLRATDTEGVFLNEFNVPVDHLGLALSFSKLRALDRSKLREVIDEEVDSPARFLKALALDPRQPLSLRFEAAKAAAPYFDRKTPIAVDGGTDPNSKPLQLQNIGALDLKELEVLQALLAKAGVPL